VSRPLSARARALPPHWHEARHDRDAHSKLTRRAGRFAAACTL
jgi:hypothetical protein